MVGGQQLLYSRFQLSITITIEPALSRLIGYGKRGKMWLYSCITREYKGNIDLTKGGGCVAISHRCYPVSTQLLVSLNGRILSEYTSQLFLDARERVRTRTSPSPESGHSLGVFNDPQLEWCVIGATLGYSYLYY